MTERGVREGADRVPSNTRGIETALVADEPLSGAVLDHNAPVSHPCSSAQVQDGPTPRRTHNNHALKLEIEVVVQPDHYPLLALQELEDDVLLVQRMQRVSSETPEGRAAGPARRVRTDDGLNHSSALFAAHDGRM